MWLQVSLFAVFGLSLVLGLSLRRRMPRRLVRRSSGLQSLLGCLVFCLGASDSNDGLMLLGLMLMLLDVAEKQRQRARTI